MADFVSARAGAIALEVTFLPPILSRPFLRIPALFYGARAAFALHSLPFFPPILSPLSLSRFLLPPPISPRFPYFHFPLLVLLFFARFAGAMAQETRKLAYARRDLRSPGDSFPF